MKYKKQKLKREIKWKMIAGLDPQELVLLKFTKETEAKQLRWEHSKEFEFKGQMYDVVSKESHGDTTYFRCWWDYEETALNKQLQKLIQIAWGNSPDNEQQQKTLKEFFKQFYHAPAYCFFVEHEALHSTNFSKASRIYFSPVFVPVSPPPELL